MFCSNCGNEIDEKSKFCSFCGKQIDNNNQEELKNSNKFELNIKYISLILVALILAVAYFTVEMVKLYSKNYDKKKQEVIAYNQNEAYNQCLADQEENYLSHWNKNCKMLGKKEDCSLPLDLAKNIDKDRENNKKQCLENLKNQAFNSMIELEDNEINFLATIGKNEEDIQKFINKRRKQLKTDFQIKKELLTFIDKKGYNKDNMYTDNNGELIIEFDNGFKYYSKYVNEEEINILDFINNYKKEKNIDINQKITKNELVEIVKKNKVKDYEYDEDKTLAKKLIKKYPNLKMFVK